jgi:hypothetical protein
MNILGHISLVGWLVLVFIGFYGFGGYHTAKGTYINVSYCYFQKNQIFSRQIITKFEQPAVSAICLPRPFSAHAVRDF